MGLREDGLRIMSRLEETSSRWVAMLGEKEEDVKTQKRILESPEAQTDIRENAVYQIAKDKFSQLQLDIKNLTDKIDSFQKFDLTAYKRSGYIGEGTTVRLLLTNHNKEFVILIVPSDLGSAKNGAISTKSKVGEALLGKAEGDTVSVNTRIGILSYLIKEVY